MSEEDSNNTFEISRRKTLAALGTIGAASAGAGLGTSAWFNDTESFENNTISAGDLDLKVDWQQTYNGPHPETGEIGWHPVNAYPDTDGDGLQDLNGVRYSGAGDVDPVFDAADIPGCCDCEEGEYYLTFGGESYCIEPLSGVGSVEDFYDYVGTGGAVEYSSQNDAIQREDASVIFLYEDGDGNLSLVFVNDAYTNEDGGSAASFTIEGAPQDTGWLVGDGEWKVKDDTEGDLNQGFEQYEEWEIDWAWGPDRTDGGAIGYFEDDFAIEISPSFNGAADRDQLGSGQIEELVVLSGGSGLGDGSDEILLRDGIGDEAVGPIALHSACGIESGEELPEDVFTSDLYPDQEHLIEFADLKPGDEGEVTFSLHLCDNPGYIWMNGQLVSASENGVTEPEAAAEGEEEDVVELLDKVEVTLWYDTDCDNELGDEEEIIADGIPLRDALDALSQNGGLGIPLDGDRSTEFDELEDAADDENRDPFENSTTQCIGFEWELPGEEVGNEIQTDSAVFDLGFYTEQARHNDGAGQSIDENDTQDGDHGTDENGTGV
ncbi:SipW-dependent-type signal peptide-containing protein [Halodesulfurarchaeum formicicum]|uniref:von Willebrand factor type A n=1 Tax=Halodesulfurarchaeum formicicum TaxID=1873524 RepID=A0A1J1ABW9_9EURY|nr:SipW-dependent-type signal peptide-containing protein [Halodesulfurarchaeum formicicum]APE95373.1 hypothetical protein HSR6_0920 [Halodesulfurarchaeum formicicum]